MIVYANRDRTAGVGELLEPVAAAAERLRRSEAADHESAVELLVAFGDLETAVADAVCGDADRATPLTRALRRLALRVGRLVVATWDGRRTAAERHREAALAGLDALDVRALPARVRPRVPEGYVYYSLMPEQYVEAARRFALEVRPAPCLCIGLRSIGASLSAVVAAALAEAGCPVRSHTLRPRGEPFDRGVSLSPGLEDELRRGAAGAHVLLVDEGPGLSGSSFAGAARRIVEIGGLRDDRLVLFPSWQPDPGRFVSPRAREQWRRHRSVVASFEQAWVDGGRLARAFGARSLVDVSAGRWRSLAYPDASLHPAVHPHHERRKYLARGGGSGTRLLKFSGLGRYGRLALARAVALAGAGYGPRPRRVRHGFLEMDFVEGRPLGPSDATGPFLEHAAGYVAFLARADPRPEPVRFADLVEMMETNAGEALGPEAAARAAQLAAEHEPRVRQGRAIAVDGRMLPHEWLLTPDGRWVKTDGVDHSDDHYFPGRQDAAWDVAGTIVEFSLDPSAARGLVERCSARTGDVRLAERLPFYRAAYLAYRLGYCTLAAESVDAPEEHSRFAALRDRYAMALAEALGAGGAEPAVA